MAIIFNGKRLKIFPLKPGSMPGCPLSYHYSTYSVIRQEKEIKDTQSRKFSVYMHHPICRKP